MSTKTEHEGDRVIYHHFDNIWMKEAFGMSVERKDEIGKLYLEKVLRANGGTAQDFVNGSQEAYHNVGVTQGNGAPKADLKGFWEGVKKMFPDDYTQVDVDYLAGENDAYAAIAFILRLDPPPPSRMESPVLKRIGENGHIYK